MGGQLVGVPVAPLESVASLRAAQDALLAAGRTLARVMRDGDDNETALDEWIAGCLATQSRDVAMIRLMIEYAEAKT